MGGGGGEGGGLRELGRRMRGRDKRNGGGKRERVIVTVRIY